MIRDSNGGGKTLIISPERMFIAIFVYVIGLVLMMASDTQKILCTKDGKRIQSRQNLNQGWVVSQSVAIQITPVKLCYIPLLQFAHSRGFRGSCTVCYGV